MKTENPAKAGISVVVRVEGLEPPSLAALDPKSSVSTNFTTPALLKRIAKVREFLIKSVKGFIFFDLTAAVLWAV